MRDDTYKFRIDSFTPSTIPMHRLAEYMLELAKLLGNEQSVHFKELKSGSAVLVSTVEHVAVPKVRERLTRIDAKATGPRGATAVDDASNPFRKLNSMLAHDNAVGRLHRGTAVILSFPGRQSARVKIGPVTQPTTLVGQLVRIGGRDASAHALVEDAEGRSWKILMTRDQARPLGQHLYGDCLRFSGSGRWFRTEEGRWELEELRLQSCEPIANESLRDSVNALRLIEGTDWRTVDDQAKALDTIRNGKPGVH
jgi:hypothetical protein